MNEVSDYKFNIVYNDKVNKAVISKATRRFRKDIPKDDLIRCGLMATWKSIQKYDENRKAQFTSYLYKRTLWECLDYLTEKYRNNKMLCQMDVDTFPDKEPGHFEDIIEELPSEEQKLLRQRFFYGMTLEEIGIENGYSYETSRYQLIRVLKNLKSRISD
jgi:RNA polymerase sigma factor (sigma-70 family)